MSDFNERTIFVINHSLVFAQPSGDEIAIDPNPQQVTELILYQKPIWSNIVDAVAQYCRVVFDLFGFDKRISIILFDTKSQVILNWDDAQQNLPYLWNAFTVAGRPTNGSSQECSPWLEDVCKLIICPGSDSVIKSGRIIVIGSSMKAHIQSWLLSAMKKLLQSKSVTSAQQQKQYEWLFIDVSPPDQSKNQEFSMKPEPFKMMLIISNTTTPTGGDATFQIDPPFPHHFQQFPPQFTDNSSTVAFSVFHHIMPSNGVEMHRRFMRSLESHFNLVSTSVCDIPMKEETGSAAAASGNRGSVYYGVEILHRSEVYQLLDKLGGVLNSLLSRDPQSGLPIEPQSGFSKTFGIKWLIPRATDSPDLRYVQSVHRVTLADTGSRASACLTQFVLSGREVTLANYHQIPLPALSKLTVPQSMINWTPGLSDELLLLTCHGSVMYLHAMASLCPLAHPLVQPISSKSDLDLVDLRLGEFVKYLLLPSRLAPASPFQSCSVAPAKRAWEHLERFTRYWPIRNSQTSLFKKTNSLPLFTCLPKEFLESNEVAACEDSIFNLRTEIKMPISQHDLKKGGTRRTSSKNTPGSAHTPSPSDSIDRASQGEALAALLELDYLVADCFADLSPDHKHIALSWSNVKERALENVAPSSNDNQSSNGSSLIDSLSTMHWNKLLTVGKFLLQTNEDDDDEIDLPPLLVSAVRQLDQLRRQLKQSNSTIISLSSLAVGSGSKSLLTSKSGSKRDSLVIQPVDNGEFISQLHAKSKQSRLANVPAKLDFVGVASADANGKCQLYSGLRRDKEKKDRARSSTTSTVASS